MSSKILECWLVVWQLDEDTEVSAFSSKAEAMKHFDKYTGCLDREAHLWLTKVTKKLEPNPEPNHKLLEYK